MVARRLLRGASSVWGAIDGHLWTVAPVARMALRQRPVSAHEPLSVTVTDPRAGAVELRGALHRTGSDVLVVAIHGLGGDIDSHYVRRTANLATRAGVDCLRLNLRGAGMCGGHIYHAGLVEDLEALVAAPALARYRHIALLGFSVGGHLVLRYALAPQADRVAAVAAICPPLDLDRAVTDIDQPVRAPYRHHVLDALKDLYRASAARYDMPIPVARAQAIRHLREWDRLIVAPQFGFDSPASYYAATSVAPRLEELQIPSLFVSTRHDPMVLARTLDDVLALHGPGKLHIRWLERGGHVGFRPGATLGMHAPDGIEAQAIAWLLAEVREARAGR